MDREREMRVRMQVFDHLRDLRERNGGAVPSGLLEERLAVDGTSIAIMSRQQGIHKPKQLGAALTLKTSSSNPYRDSVDEFEGGVIRYHYRDPSIEGPRAMKMAEADNRSVRTTIQHRLPIAYLWGIDKGWYLPFAPVEVVSDDPAGREFYLDLTELGGLDLRTRDGVVDLGAETPSRRYQAREVKVRVHQARFRQMVMRAYRRACGMCRLRHVDLLDAAHILEDARGGEPRVTNGVALCKIHHAAFDRNVLGIEPGTLRLHVRQDILEEVDGPMLRYGLQALHGERLHAPSRASERPAADALAVRWEHFRSA